MNGQPLKARFPRNIEGWRIFARKIVTQSAVFLAKNKNRKNNKTIKTPEFEIGNKHPVFVIAEIGVNHEGDLGEAKRLIEKAAEAGVNAVKFQKRDLEASYKREVVREPQLHDQSLRYLIPILKSVEFGEKEYKELVKHAEKFGLTPLVTPFDSPSVDFAEKNIDPPVYKIASADLVNFILLEKVIATGKPILLSTGMSSVEEIDETVLFLTKRKAKFMLLHCQSTYPAALDTINLNFIKTLRNRYGLPVGYSGHETTLEPTLLAVALGACLVERHITLDKNTLGPDHAASLLPEEFKTLVQKIRDAETTLGVANKRLTRGEIQNRIALRKSLVAAKNIREGEVIRKSSVAAKGPGFGLSPQKLYDLIGKKARRDLKEDEHFVPEDLSGKSEVIMPENIPGNWGLKSRFFETDALLSFAPKPRFLEHHITDKDLDFNFPDGAKYPFELYIHAPEYNDRAPVDMASLDEKLWNDSLKIIQKTIDKTRKVAKHFVGTPKIVIHVGGMSIEPPKKTENRKMLLRAIEAFRRLDCRGVEIMPENLPAFGWFFGGLWHINIFGAASEMIEFCETLNLKMCFDSSHAWLYCQEKKIDFLEYVRQIAPYTRHLHLSDGRGTLKEGLQIGEGDIPFEEMFAVMKKHLPNGGKNISYVPEIWQGHLHNYREFKTALAQLSRYSFFGQ